MKLSEDLVIRRIQPGDSKFLYELIVATLAEYGLGGEGTVATDPEIQDMYSSYTRDGWGYWVVEDLRTGELLGGAGYGPLKGASPGPLTCEFQKAYLVKDARGKGLGRGMLELRLKEAVKDGYQQAYMETIPTMRSVKLFEKAGFRRLEEPLGDTGHTKLTVFMSREIC